MQLIYTEMYNPSLTPFIHIKSSAVSFVYELLLHIDTGF